MAVDQHSTCTPERPLLPGTTEPVCLPPAQQAELLAILDAGPLPAAAWGFRMPAQRRAAQDGIDALIAALDALEGDTDLEPSFGAPEHGMTCRYGQGDIDRLCDQTWWARGGDTDEREDVSEDEGACIQSQRHDAEPDEPALGAPDGVLDQRRWAQGQGSVEGDHDDHFDMRNGSAARYEAHVAGRKKGHVLLARYGLGRYRDVDEIVLLDPDGFLRLGRRVA